MTIKPTADRGQKIAPPAGTRQERAQELNELVKTEDGLTEILQTYQRECVPQTDRNPTHALMIDAILDAEVPARPPGFLSRS